jgi:hypothetical protein
MMATEAARALARPSSKKSSGQAAHLAASSQRLVSAPHRRCAVPYRSDRAGYCSRHLLEQGLSRVATPRQAPVPRPSYHRKYASLTRDHSPAADLTPRSGGTSVARQG